MRIFGILTVVVAVAAVVTPARAQVTRADTARVLYQVALDLQEQGRADDAEQLFALLRWRYSDTEFGQLAHEALTGSVQEREAAGGRTELIAWSTVYGASLGVLIPAALGANEAEPFGLGLLLGGPIGFGLSSSWSRQHPVSPGQARAMTFGSWWGTWQGLGWQQVLHLGDRKQTQCFDTGTGTECFEFYEESEEAPFTSMVLGGLTGMAIGTAIGRARPISASSAVITNFSSMWGTWFGLVVGTLINPDNNNSFGPDEGHHQLVASLVGGNVGLMAGAFGAPALGWSRSQAWTVHLAGFAGVVAGFGLDLLTSVEDEKGAIALPAITSAAALIAAGYAVSNNRPTNDTGGGFQMSLLEYSGGDVSLGIPIPVPTLVQTWRGSERLIKPGVRVSLLRVGM